MVLGEDHSGSAHRDDVADGCTDQPEQHNDTEGRISVVPKDESKQTDTSVGPFSCKTSKPSTTRDDEEEKTRKSKKQAHLSVEELIKKWIVAFKIDSTQNEQVPPNYRTPEARLDLLAREVDLLSVGRASICPRLLKKESQAFVVGSFQPSFYQ